MSTPSPAGLAAANPRLVTWTHTMYALHALSIAVGVVTTVLGQRTFLFGIPSVIALVMNLLHRSGVRGTWLGSHFAWQLRTFGWVLVGLAAASLAFGSIVIILTRVPLLEISFLLLGVWTGVRALRGWLALREGRAIAPRGIF